MWTKVSEADFISKKKQWEKFTQESADLLQVLFLQRCGWGFGIAVKTVCPMCIRDAKRLKKLCCNTTQNKTHTNLHRLYQTEKLTQFSQEQGTYSVYFITLWALCPNVCEKRWLVKLFTCMAHQKQEQNDISSPSSLTLHPLYQDNYLISFN